MKRISMDRSVECLNKNIQLKPKRLNNTFRVLAAKKRFCMSFEPVMTTAETVYSCMTNN